MLLCTNFLRSCFCTSTLSKSASIAAASQKYNNTAPARTGSPNSTPQGYVPPPPKKQQPRQTVRLSKLITQNSICSRREAQKIIQLGLVRVNGERIFQNMLVPIGDHEIKVLTNKGVIRQQKPVTKLWAMNKPRGYICTQKDPEGRPTIYQLIPNELKSVFGHIMSVGRLDYNSEGLLLLTNDNMLKQILQSPETNLPRQYRVKVHGRVTNQKLDKMQKPITISGEVYGPLKVTVDRSLSTNVWLDIKLMTGKNREVRKIMQKCDLQVSKLVRTAYGPYMLGSMKHGELVEEVIRSRFLKQMQRRVIKTMSGGKNTFIEMDLRPAAIEYAKNQRQAQLANEEEQAEPTKLIH